MEIVVSDVLIDLLHQFAHTAKRTTPDCALGDKSKPAFDLVKPACISRGEMKVIAGMACQPGSDPRMFVGGVVVSD